MDNVLAGLEDIIGHFGDNRLRVSTCHHRNGYHIFGWVLKILANSMWEVCMMLYASIFTLLLQYKFQNLDVNYLRKLFERKAESREEQILQTFHRLQYM